MIMSVSKEWDRRLHDEQCGGEKPKQEFRCPECGEVINKIRTTIIAEPPQYQQYIDGEGYITEEVDDYEPTFEQPDYKHECIKCDADITKHIDQ